MEKMNIFLSSKSTVISEDKNYLELLNRVCYYSVANYNGTRLPYDETALEKAQTLVGMPVVAKYTVDNLGKPTFKGHEVSIDANGDITFGTTPIGVHTEVYIQDDSVELPDKSIATLPCLFAKQKIWKRNKNAVAAINRLYSEGNLHNSWEINVSEYRFIDGIKDLINYVFEANCLLGLAKPAYGPSAEVLNVATKSNELLVAEALSQDLLENDSTGNEVQEMEDEKIIDTSEEEVDSGGVENAEEEGKEAAASHEETGTAEEKEEVTEPETQEKAELTMRDLRWKIEEALYKFADRYLDVVFIFPESHTGWAHDWSENETDMNEFSYTVESEEVMISSLSPVVLIVAPRNINSAFDEKNSALVDANKQINDLTAQVAALSIYKEAAEKAEQEAAEAKRQTDIAELRQYVETSGVLTKEEVESDEVAALINDLKTLEVKALIADRIVGKKKDKSHETTEKKQPKPRMVLSDTTPSDSYAVFKDFLHR